MTENKKGLAVQLSLSKCQTCKVLDIQPVQCSNECSHALPHIKVKRGGCEEIPLVQGKEQRLRFAGAAVKRYPTSKVRETQVRR